MGRGARSGTWSGSNPGDPRFSPVPHASRLKSKVSTFKEGSQVGWVQ